MKSADRIDLGELGPVTALTAEDFNHDSTAVAKSLLGKILVSTIDSFLTAGRIVETEAYLPLGDSACHGALKKTPRNEVMFGLPGRAYVYSIHSRWCFNVVTAPGSKPSAVLVRAIAPLIGINTMASRRNTDNPLEYCRGPAKLCEALGINKAHNGIKLGPMQCLWLARSESCDHDHFEIKKTHRIGVTSAKELLLRFVISDSIYASGPKYLNR